MKLPVNPEVVKVYVKFYSLLKKVKEEAWKILDKIKAEAYEYVQNSKTFMQYPLLKEWLLPLLKTPEERVRDKTRVWQSVFNTTFTGEELANLFSNPSVEATKRKPLFYTPLGTPVFYGAVLPTEELGRYQGTSTSWM